MTLLPHLIQVLHTLSLPATPVPEMAALLPRELRLAGKGLVETLRKVAGGQLPIVAYITQSLVTINFIRGFQTSSLELQK